MVRAMDVDLSEECQYRDPNVKTFAWWQAAMKCDEREASNSSPGMVLPEELSDSEDAMEMDDLGQRNKHDLDGLDRIECRQGSSCLIKRPRMIEAEIPFNEADALFGQWV